MAYAVVTFCHDDLVSEVPTNWLQKDGNDCLCWWPPTNVKNVQSLISKRVSPDVQAWLLLAVNIERYCASVDKARKIAEDKNYTSCEDSQLGKGCRIKIPNKQIYSTSDSEEDKEEERKTTKAKATQSRKRKSNRNVFRDSSSNDDDDINNNNNETQEIGRKKLKPNLPQWPNDNENQVDDTFSQSQSVLKSTVNENNEISDDGNKCIVEHIKNLF